MFPDKRDSVDENIEQIHVVLLRMLKVLKTICDRHDIDFWLDYGTLLGAVRHNGFIPWDVEADIGMLRNDFIKFLKLGVPDLPSDIFFQTKESDPDYHPYGFIIEAKLRDKYSNYVSFEKKNPGIKWHNGLQIDFFIYDLHKQEDDCILNRFEQVYSDNRIHLKIDEIEFTKLHPFGDETFPIPVGFHTYLQRCYGNYMELPPIEERVIEHVDVFIPCKHKEVLYWHNK